MSTTRLVLDRGIVTLIDYMGSDYAVVRAARVSTGTEGGDINRDKRLISYLMKHGHESPFEHVVFTFYVKAPIFVARQWFRHRIGSFNEASGRYRELDEEFYIPDNVRVNNDHDKQKANIVEDKKLLRQLNDKVKDVYENAYKVYEELLNLGIARELARIVLPVGMYTEFYWTVNLRSLFNFFNLRADSHAQYEIREYAIAIAKIVSQLVPISMTAFICHAYKGDVLTLDMLNLEKDNILEHTNI